MRISDWVQTCALPIFKVDKLTKARTLSSFRLSRRRYPDCCRRSLFACERGDHGRNICTLALEALLLSRGQPNDSRGNGGNDLRGVRNGFLGEPGLATKHLGYFARHQSTNTRSEEHTSELQSLMRNSYDVFCLKKKTKLNNIKIITNEIEEQTKHNAIRTSKQNAIRTTIQRIIEIRGRLTHEIGRIKVFTLYRRYKNTAINCIIHQNTTR